MTLSFENDVSKDFGAQIFKNNISFRNFNKKQIKKAILWS